MELSLRTFRGRASASVKCASNVEALVLFRNIMPLLADEHANECVAASRYGDPLSCH